MTDAEQNARAHLASIVELINRYESSETSVDDADAAMEEIHETPLSIEVRDGWYQPGAKASTPDHVTPQSFASSSRSAGLAFGWRVISRTAQAAPSPRLEWAEWGAQGTLAVSEKEQRAMDAFADYLICPDCL